MIFRLREILKDRRITVAQFAEMSGITQANLSNYMSGKISPTLETLNKIAAALSLDVTSLFKKENDIVLMARIDDETFEINNDELIEFLKTKLKTKKQ